MRASIRLCRILGIPIEINFSWIIIFAFLTYFLFGQLDDSGFRWPLIQRLGVALVTVSLFFLSVLVHELSHSAMALYKGIPVRGITLFIFGGVSQLDKEPVSPRIELVVALIGPLISIVLASQFGLAWYLLGRGESPLEVVLLLLAWTNLSLGVLNLVPGYPLDGGRLLRAGIWGGTGNHYKATWIAARMGQAIGLAIVSGGVLLAIFTEVLDGIWMGCIGMFLFFMARHSFPK